MAAPAEGMGGRSVPEGDRSVPDGGSSVPLLDDCVTATRLASSGASVFPLILVNLTRKRKRLQIRSVPEAESRKKVLRCFVKNIGIHGITEKVPLRLKGFHERAE